MNKANQITCFCKSHEVFIVGGGDHDLMWSKINRYVRDFNIKDFDIEILWNNGVSMEFSFTDFVAGTRAIEAKIFSWYLMGNYDLDNYYLGWQGIQVDFFVAQMNRQETYNEA